MDTRTWLVVVIGVLLGSCASDAQGSDENDEDAAADEAARVAGVIASYRAKFGVSWQCTCSGSRFGGPYDIERVVCTASHDAAKALATNQNKEAGYVGFPCSCCYEPESRCMRDVAEECVQPVAMDLIDATTTRCPAPYDVACTR